MVEPQLPKFKTHTQTFKPPPPVRENLPFSGQKVVKNSKTIVSKGGTY